MKKKIFNKARKAQKKSLKKLEGYLKKLKEDLNKLKRHWYNAIEDIDYKGIKEIENLFNKINEEDYYEPIKTRHALMISI